MLLPLALAGLAEAASAAHPPAKGAATLAYLLAVVLVVQYAAQFNTRKFLVWEYDADTRRILDRISQLVANKQTGSVRVGGSWQLEPSLNFYREVNHILGQDRGVIGNLGVKPVYQGAISGTILAMPSN